MSEKKDNKKVEEKKTTTKAVKAVKVDKKVAEVKESKPVSKKKDVSEVKSSARFIKISPRKVRLVINQIRGVQVEQALSNLSFINKAATGHIIKLLKSAIANAENNFELDKKDLYIKTITADDGPTLRRFRPRAHGRSARINERTSHIKLVLVVKKDIKTAAKAQKKDKKA